MAELSESDNACEILCKVKVEWLFVLGFGEHSRKNNPSNSVTWPCDRSFQVLLPHDASTVKQDVKR